MKKGERPGSDYNVLSSIVKMLLTLYPWLFFCLQVLKESPKCTREFLSNGPQVQQQALISTINGLFWLSHFAARYLAPSS